MLSLMLPCISCWTNNRVADDFKRHDVHLTWHALWHSRICQLTFLFLSSYKISNLQFLTNDKWKYGARFNLKKKKGWFRINWHKYRNHILYRWIVYATATINLLINEICNFQIHCSRNPGSYTFLIVVNDIRKLPSAINKRTSLVSHYLFS